MNIYLDQTLVQTLLGFLTLQPLTYPYPYPSKPLTLGWGQGFWRVRVRVSLSWPQGYPCSSLNSFISTPLLWFHLLHVLNTFFSFPFIIYTISTLYTLPQHSLTSFYLSFHYCCLNAASLMTHEIHNSYWLIHIATFICI